MNLSEFKAWFEGFTEQMPGPLLSHSRLDDKVSIKLSPTPG